MRELLLDEQAPPPEVRLARAYGRRARGRALAQRLPDWAAGEGLLEPTTRITDPTSSRRDEVLAVLTPADGDAFVSLPTCPAATRASSCAAPFRATQPR